MYSINSVAKRYQISDTQRALRRCPFLTPAEGDLSTEVCEICFHECVKNKGYALRCRMWLTPDIYAAKLRRVLKFNPKKAQEISQPFYQLCDPPPPKPPPEKPPILPLDAEALLSAAIFAACSLITLSRIFEEYSMCGFIM